MASDLEILDETDGPVCVVTVKGEVDLYTSATLKSRLVTLVEVSAGDMVIDLSDVSFIDSSGLGVLMGVLRRAKERGGSVRLAGTREGVLKTFRITGLDKVFPMFSTVAEAKAL